MTLGDICRFLDECAPRFLQESYDNAGLLLGEAKNEISGALICLDVTEEVIDEAIQKNAQLIIAHHPLIFKPIKRLVADTKLERTLLKAIRADIGIYAIHTNLDNLRNGVSMALANELGLLNLKVLRPLDGALRKLVTFCPDAHVDRVRESLFSAGAGHIGNYDGCSFNVKGMGTFRGLEGAEPFVGKPGEKHQEQETRIETVFPVWLESKVVSALWKSHPYEEVAFDIYPLTNADPTKGSGLIGDLPEPMACEAFLGSLKSKLGIPFIRYANSVQEKIQRIALCGGAGSFLIPDARSARADAFITGDLKYHDFFEGGDKMLLADIGHFESEQFTLPLLKDWLNGKFPTFAAHITEVKTNPIHYL